MTMMCLMRRRGAGWVDERMGVMQKKIRIGITFGCFIPLHKGHLSVIQQAESENTRIILGVTGYDMDRGRDFVPFLRRVRLMNSIYGNRTNITVSEVDDKAIGLSGTFSISAWKSWCEELFYNAGYSPYDQRYEFHWYIGEEKYIEKIKALYPRHQFHLMDRDVIPISGTAIRENPGTYMQDIHPAFLQYMRQNGQM